MDNMVVDEQPVQPSQDQGSGGIRLKLVGKHDLTQAMAGTSSCSTDSGKSNIDTDKFDTIALQHLQTKIFVKLSLVAYFLILLV